jgi:hypothetical protein
MISDSEPVFSFRMTSRDDGASVFILVSAILKASDRSLVSIESIASATGSVLLNLPPKATYKDFANRIQSFKYRGEQLRNHSTQLHDIFKSKLSSESFLEELFHYIERKDISKVKSLLSKSVAESGNSNAPKIDFIWERINFKDANKTLISVDATGHEHIVLPGSQAAKENSNTDQTHIDPKMASDLDAATSRENPTSFVNYKFLLSPVSGVAVTDLKIGDKVYIKIEPGDSLSDSTIHNMKLIDPNGNVLPTPAFVHSIVHTGTQSEVVIKIKDGLFGKSVEEENTVRVRTHDIDPTKVKGGPGVTSNKLDPALEAEESSLFLTMVVVFGLLGVVGIIIVFIL